MVYLDVLCKFLFIFTKIDSKFVISSICFHLKNNHIPTDAPVLKLRNYIKEVIPGENVTFDCVAEGNPPPEIRWEHTSAVNVIQTTGGRQKSIRITGATSTNAGVYTCVATNKVASVTTSVTLALKGKATISIKLF